MVVRVGGALIASMGHAEAQGYPARRLVTVAEAADLLRVSRKTIQRMRERGDLTTIEVGPRLVRFHPDDIAALLNGETLAGRPGLRDNPIASAGGNRGRL